MQSIYISQYSPAEKFMQIGVTKDWRPIFRGFDEVAAQFPNLVKDDENRSPEWGGALYVKGENGKCELWKENWDSSD